MADLAVDMTLHSAHVTVKIRVTDGETIVEPWDWSTRPGLTVIERRLVNAAMVEAVLSTARQRRD